MNKNVIWHYDYFKMQICDPPPASWMDVERVRESISLGVLKRETSLIHYYEKKCNWQCIIIAKSKATVFIITKSISNLVVEDGLKETP